MSNKSVDYKTLDDVMYELFKGRNCIAGVNTRLHNDIINDKNSTKEEKKESYSQLGKDSNGNWNYVHNGKCNHVLTHNERIEKNGQNINNRWHPSKQECEYLKNKNK